MDSRPQNLARNGLLPGLVIGYGDDYKKLVLQDPKGISAKQKLFWQSATAIVAAIALTVVSVEGSPMEELLVGARMIA